MSQASDKAAWEDEFKMKTEYDFSDSIANPYAARFAGVSKLVLLDDDGAAAFSDSASVNEALRLLIKTAEEVQSLPKAS